MVELVSFEVGYLLEISKQNVEDETWFLLASFRKYVKYEKKEINWGKKLCQKKSALDELEISTYPENMLWDRDKGVCEQLFAKLGMWFMDPVSHLSRSQDWGWDYLEGSESNDEVTPDIH